MTSLAEEQIPSPEHGRDIPDLTWERPKGLQSVQLPLEPYTQSAMAAPDTDII